MGLAGARSTLVSTGPCLDWPKPASRSLAVGVSASVALAAFGAELPSMGAVVSGLLTLAVSTFGAVSLVLLAQV